MQNRDKGKVNTNFKISMKMKKNIYIKNGLHGKYSQPTEFFA